MEDTEIRPFRIAVPQGDLDDLRDRLARTRWPDQLPGVGWSYGIPLERVKELAEYWRTEYDWRRHEARLNEFPQFTTEIDGQRVHFLHARSPEPDALPLILTHGRPSTFADFSRMVGPLTDPRAHGGDPGNAFHVVAPSIPGFAFSGPTRERGWGLERVARAWAELMRRLGYERYGAQGNDFGGQARPALPRPHRRSRVPRGLHRPPLRRTRQRDHPLDRARRGRPLRRPGGPGTADVPHPGVLPPPPLTVPDAFV
ncbi:epoxide hydrolase [Actinomadura sp. NPDC047616]|uniref:epoxide hydrolase family protein n=1 Tax=Actinomadura sp. NPDC047616 TaxID=3155914 RepID=UPI0033E8A31A